MTREINKQQYLKTNFANRGMGLEEDLEKTNQYYLETNMAIIHKKPTPITVKKVTYPNQKYTKITDGYFTKPSTTDYNGIYRGKYIDFEAKETKNNSLAISAIHQHQIKHLKSIQEHGGISFLIIRFITKNETYLLPSQRLFELISEQKRKSISHQYVSDHGHIISLKYTPRLDYLKIIDKLFF